MADAITGLIGAVVMVGYIYLIADKLNELPLWICAIAGLALMAYAFWIDAWRPWLLRNNSK
jgi:hypothetical protein